jgi:hypothetical protein
MSVQNYPLHWPADKKRTLPANRRSAAFSKRVHNGRYEEKKLLSIADAINRLQRELDMLGARYLVLSTNVEPRLDGLPRSDRTQPQDPGVAVYYRIDGEPFCLPCDTFDRVADNIAAIAAHIEAVRKIERYGVATSKQMFAGFSQLPAPGSNSARTWRDVLRWPDGSAVTKTGIDVVYRALAKELHPDRPGGSEAAMAELNRAREEAIAEMNRENN